jgi:hypothetical protein
MTRRDLYAEAKGVASLLVMLEAAKGDISNAQHLIQVGDPPAETTALKWISNAISVLNSCATLYEMHLKSKKGGNFDALDY